MLFISQSLPLSIIFPFPHFFSITSCFPTQSFSVLISLFPFLPILFQFPSLLWSFPLSFWYPSLGPVTSVLFVFQYPSLSPISCSLSHCLPTLPLTFPSLLYPTLLHSSPLLPLLHPFSIFLPLHSPALIFYPSPTLSSPFLLPFPYTP